MTTTILLFDLEDLRRKWGWFLVLGITMIVFGTIALSIIPAATIGTVMVLRLADRAERHHGGYTWVPGAEVGRRLPAPDCRDSGSADWLADCHSSCCRRTRMDATVCVVFHHHRSFPASCGDEAEVSQLGLGGFRWHSYSSVGDPTLGRVAVVGVLVPGSRRWSLANPAWVVIRDVRDRGSQLSCGKSVASCSLKQRAA